MSKTVNRLISAAATAILLLQTVFGLFSGSGTVAWAEEDKAIHIATAADLINLSKKCRINSYSDRKTVVLDCDIDLMGAAFMPIATFGGVFDGQGHKISGFVPGTNGSHQGFFRYIQETGDIRNLTVSGTVRPGGSRCQVGGLAGVNRGRISSCEFDGAVEGLNYIGGLAGVNYGEITDCAVTGNVSGKRYTGGIAGYSEGEISGCRNSASVNIRITEGGIELNNLNINNFSDTFALISAQDTDIVSDTGGVVGFSSGTVKDCGNSGTVGYQHYGYNTGGIAGRQSGYMTGCMNSGSIFGRKDVGGIVGQMEPNLILKNRRVLSDEINTLTYLLSCTILDASDMSENVTDALDEMRRNAKLLLEDFADAIPERSWDESTPEEFDLRDPGDIQSGIEEHISSWEDNINKEKVNLDIIGLTSAMSYMTAAMNDAVGLTSEDLEDVNRQANVVLSLISSALGGNLYTDVYEDESETASAGETSGKVEKCANSGEISGDTNTGGISGAMEIEYEFDMEGTLAEAVSDYTQRGNVVSSTFKSKCISAENINSGSVDAKKDCAGGIAGLQNAGIVTNCENYGNIRADGKYAGGIAGSSCSVSKCYSMCTVEGAEYAGGISGLGEKITESAAIVNIDPSTACCGGIAGYLDRIDKEHLLKNTFLNDNLGGVDGISYYGQAEPVEYSYYASDKNAPEMFRKLTVIFKADGKTVREVPFEYGSGISEEEIPAVPQKAGYIGRWPDIDLNCLYSGMIVEAEYGEYLSTIATEYLREGRGLPLLVLEGSFTDSASAEVRSFSGAAAEPPESEVLLEAWEYEVSGSVGDTISVRYCSPEVTKPLHDLILYTLEDGEWVQKEYEPHGSYIAFEADGSRGVFCAADRRNDAKLKKITYLAAAAAVLIVMRIVAGAIKKAGKRKKNREH